MRKYLIILITISLFFLSGCLDVETKINLNPDGSGTIEETILMSNAVVDMMKSFASMSGEAEEDEEFSIYDEAEIKNEAAEYGEGVSLLKSEPINDNGKQGYKAVFSFDDINKIMLDQNPTDKMSGMGMEDDEKEQEEPIRFTFEKGNPSVLTINLPESELEEDDEFEEEEEYEDEWDNEEDESADEWTEEAKEMMKDMRVKMSINFNGDIIETNATNVEGSEVVLLEMDFGKLMEDPEKLELLKNNEPETLEEAKEMLGDIEGFKFEFNRKVETKFE